jgi:hypothetical protein
MSGSFSDRVQEFTNTAGSGSFALRGAVPGFTSFAAAYPTGSSPYYAAVDPISEAWEVGQGTFNPATNTITRSPLASSNGGALVNFAGNATTTVWVDVPAAFLNALGGTGTVTGVVAGIGLEVGGTPGGTITAAGTLNVLAATTTALGGIIVGSGATVNAGGTLSVTASGSGTVTTLTPGAGISFSTNPITTTGTISNAGVIQFGTDAGTITIAAPLYETSGTHGLNVGSGLSVSSGTLVNSGVLAVTAGTGITFSGTDTINNAGVLTFGAVTGAVTLGPSLSMSGQTLDVSFPTGFGPIVAGLGLAGGTISASGTITLDVASGSHLGGIIAGANTTINAGGTLSVAAPGTGTVTSVVAGSGLGGGTITSTGTLTNAGVIQFGTDTGTIAMGAGVSEASGTLSNSGVLLFGGLSGTVVLGTHLSASGQTINASGGLAAPSAGLVYSDGTILGAVSPLIGLNYVTGALAINYGTGLSITSNTLVNAGVLSFGAATGAVVLGTNLAMSGQTLTVGAGAGDLGTVTSIVAGNQLTGGAITAAGTIAVSTTPTFASETLTGTISAGPLLTLIDISSTAVTPRSNTALQLVGHDAISTRIEMVTFGTAASSGVLQRGAAGTSATPTAVQLNQIIGSSSFSGYDGSSFVTTQGKLQFTATENWVSGSNLGMEAQIVVNNTGTTTQSTYTFKDGNLTVPVGVISGTGTTTAVAGAATLNKNGGVVTSEGLTAATTYTLTLTNSNILSGSVVLVNATDSAGVGVILSRVTVSAGSVAIVVTMAALTGTVMIAFAVHN